MTQASLNRGEAYDRIAEVMGCKWSLLILDSINLGVTRPGAIERSHQGLTATVLHRCLNRMERDGLIHKTVFDELPQRVEYGLTAQGRRFWQIVEQARELAVNWQGTQPAGQVD